MSEEQPASPLPTNNQQTEKIWIFKNVAIISFSFLLSFTAFTGTVNLQSSLNNSEELGNKALTALNLGAILSNIFTSVPAVNTLGLKWSLILSLAMHTTFPASNCYPTWYILYLGAFITGLGAGPLWNAKSLYLTSFGEKYAKLVHESAEASISRIFGIFFMVYHISHLTGNVLSSFILQKRSTIVLSSSAQALLAKICGVHYCYPKFSETSQHVNHSYLQPDLILKNVTVKFHKHFEYNNHTATSENDYGNFSSLYTTTSFQTYLLFGTYLMCSSLACMIASFVANVRNDSAAKKSTSIWLLMLPIFRHMKNLKEVMLIPLSFFSGVSYAFITADYCLGFITCTIGIDNVGFVMAVFGTVAGLASLIFGRLLKYISRQAIFTFGAILNISVLLAMIHWAPSSETYFLFYIFSGMWGISHAVWTSQLIGNKLLLDSYLETLANRQRLLVITYGRCLEIACGILLVCIYVLKPKSML